MQPNYFHQERTITMNNNTSVYIPKHLTADTKVAELKDGTPLYAKDFYSTEDHALNTLRKFGNEYRDLKGHLSYRTSLSVTGSVLDVSGVFDLIDFSIDTDNKKVTLAIMADMEANSDPTEMFRNCSPLYIKFEFETLTQDLEPEMYDFGFWFSLPDGGEVELGIH